MSRRTELTRATMATLATVADGAQAAPAPAGIAGRYALRGLLDQGGFGTVYRAEDRISREEVALKVVSGMDPASRIRLRRELAALRWLRMPGVVNLRDDGPLGDDDWFIVMDLVPGHKFPQDGRPWSEMRATVEALLEILGRVHAAGVLHRDLKPANVLVEDGRPVVLDFGIARGEAITRKGRSGEYTPGFAPPEQQADGEQDARSDLYSVGRMVERAVDLGTAPPGVADLLARLTAEDPHDRPPSAEVALEALREADPELRPAPVAMAGQRTAAELRELFAGPDHFLHLREDAAHLLHARTRGEPDAVSRELRAWVSGGHARFVEGLYVVDRVAIERLGAETDPVEGALYAGLREGSAPAELADRALAVARLHAASARPARAVAALELGLAMTRLAGGDEGPLNIAVADAALAQESPAAIERALYDLERGDDPCPNLLALLRGVRAALRREGPRAADLLDALPPFADEELETWRHAFRVMAGAAIGIAAEEQVCAGLEEWGESSAVRRARLDGWLGNLRYRQNRFAEAAALHLRSARGRTTAAGQMSARLNAALALLEDLDSEGASAAAAELVRQARSLRHALYECVATWLLRHGAYRSGTPLAPDRAIVDAAGRVRASLHAQLALNEAAAAWRLGRCDLAAELAALAARRFSERGEEEGAALALALAAAADPRAPLEAHLEREWRVPDLGVQALALAALAGTPAAEGRVLELARSRPREQWSRRLDVLSYDEALAAVQGTVSTV